jgi:hypothetical protein
MANNKKIFALTYDTNKKDKLHKFINDVCNYKKGGDNKKYLHWAHYNGFYTLSTLENTYWDVNKLCEAIYKYMDNDISLFIFEIQGSIFYGKMPDKYWKFWKESQNLNETIDNYNRAMKLKKLTTYINKKKELERKEKELKRKEIEIQKALSLKKIEDELKLKEKELQELERELNEEPEKTLKKRWWKR